MQSRTGPSFEPLVADEPSATDDSRIDSCRSPLGTYPECPLCGGALAPEHAHFRCGACGWRDSCCD